MTPSLGHRVDVAARRLTPFAISLVLVLVAAVPWRVPHFGPVAPMLGLIAVYYWAVFRPDLLPPVAVFVLGLIADSLGAAPFGLAPLVFLAVYGIVRGQRRFLVGKSFLVLWWGFLLIAPGAALIDWAVNAAMARVLIDPLPAVFRTLLTIAIFPALAWLLVHAQRAFLRHA